MGLFSTLEKSCSTVTISDYFGHMYIFCPVEKLVDMYMVKINIISFCVPCTLFLQELYGLDLSDYMERIASCKALSRTGLFQCRSLNPRWLSLGPSSFCYCFSCCCFCFAFGGAATTTKLLLVKTGSVSNQ